MSFFFGQSLSVVAVFASPLELDKMSLKAAQLGETSHIWQKGFDSAEVVFHMDSN